MTSAVAASTMSVWAASRFAALTVETDPTNRSLVFTTDNIFVADGWLPGP